MSKQFDDALLVAEYRICRRCRIVAEKYGCSDETVRRALIKYGEPRIIRHPRGKTKRKATEEELRAIVDEYYATDVDINTLARKHHRAQNTISKAIKEYGCGLKKNAVNGRKITDDELREEAKMLNCKEIALKYDMSEERVYRRAKKLGIDILTKYEGGKWYKRASRYGCKDFDETITLRALITRDNGVCQICGKPTDDCDITNGHIGRMYPTLDHIIPLSKGGTHTWDNVQLAHMHCNAGKCNRIA